MKRCVTDTPLVCYDQGLSNTSSLPPTTEHGAPVEVVPVDEMETTDGPPSPGGFAVSEKGIVEETPTTSAAIDPSTKPLVKHRRCSGLVMLIVLPSLSHWWLRLCQLMMM